MLNILEVASKGPETSLSGLGCSDRSYSVLSESYLLNTKNKDCTKGRENSYVKSTELLKEVVRELLTKLELDISDIGLIIGETSTPDQTTPSEAQRLGGLFEVKVPSFDLCAGHNSFAQCVNYFSTLKKESVPDYILWASVNCPSRLIDFSKAPDLYQGSLSDRASAAVLSLNKKGAYRVSKLKSRSLSNFELVSYVPVNSHLSFYKDGFLSQAKDALSFFRKEIEHFSCNNLVANPLLETALGEVGFNDTKLESLSLGDCIGSFDVAALAEVGKSLSSGQSLSVFTSGFGTSHSLLEFIKEE